MRASTSIGARSGAPEKLHRWREVFGAIISLGLATMEALGQM
jgi:hypothetical protein